MPRRSPRSLPPRSRAAEEEPPKPKKKTRRGSRGGRNRKKKPAAAAAAENGQAEEPEPAAAVATIHVPSPELGKDGEAAASADGEQPAAPKKKRTRRGSRGGRNRRKKPAPAAANPLQTQLPSSGRIRTLALALIRQGDRILVERGRDEVKNETFFRLLGGTVEFGEKGAESRPPRALEELGVEAEVGRLVATIENVFMYEGEASHEICLVYECALRDRKLYELDEWQAEERTPGGSVTHYVEWRSVDSFERDGEILYPEGLLEMLRGRVVSFDPDISKWDAWRPEQVQLARGRGSAWYVAAGWAIDSCWAARPRARRLEIAAPNNRFDEIVDVLDELEICIITGPHEATPLAGRDRLDETHQSWVREPATGLWRFDVFREPSDGERGCAGATRAFGFPTTR